MALPDDYTRVQQIFGSLAKKDHPMAKFMWGNLESLQLAKVRLIGEQTKRLRSNTEIVQPTLICKKFPYFLIHLMSQPPLPMTSHFVLTRPSR